MKLVILGAIGPERSKVCQTLSDHLQIPIISTGESLRAAIEAKTEVGLQAKPYLDRGELVPDPIVIALIQGRLTQADTSQGWILDGYPRTAFQAEELDFLLDTLNQQISKVISLEVSAPTLMARSPTEDPEAITRRVELFQQRTLPMLEYYSMRGRLLQVQEDGTLDQVHHRILKGLGV